MKVALVHEFLTQKGGAERVLRAFHNMFPEAPVFTLVYDKEKAGDFFGDMDVRPSFLQKLPLAARKHRYYLPLMPKAIESFDFSGYDLVISDGSSFAKGAVTEGSTFHINYCHTPTRFLWLDREKYLAQFSKNFLARAFGPMALDRLGKWDLEAAKRPDAMVANSRFIAERIRKCYGRHVEVIYPPVDTGKFCISRDIGDYFLLISRLAPYKDIDLVVEAFDKMKKPLKIIGEGEDRERLEALAGGNIEFLGWVGDEEKAKYLSQCLALVHPQVEDFGLTPVEAMASGRPVIAYRGGGALETVVEGKTGVFFDKQSVGSLSEAVKSFHPGEFDSREIREHSLQFDKKRFGEKMKDFITSSTKGKFK